MNSQIRPMVVFFAIFAFLSQVSWPDADVFAQLGHMYPIVSNYPYPVDIARDPNDVPSTLAAPGSIITIEAHEVKTFLAPKNFQDNWAGDGSDIEFRYFAFGGGQTEVTGPKVPGPFLRVREGDEVTIKLLNLGSETHSIDLHAALGKKGGAAVLMVSPGESASFTFTPQNPGIYIYHCVGDGSPFGIARHMNNGMFGLMLVEPQGGGLPAPFLGAKEFYVFEQDIYRHRRTQDYGETSMIAKESPDFVVYNGRVGALVDHPLVAQQGTNAVVYHGAAGQHIPSFHIIGEIFDWVWPEGDLVSNPRVNIQTTLVPSSGAIAVGLDGSRLVPTSLDAGDLNILVDHAFHSFRKGAIGLMIVQSEGNY